MRRNGERANTVRGWIRPTALPIEVAAAVKRSLESPLLLLDNPVFSMLTA